MSKTVKTFLIIAVVLIVAGSLLAGFGLLNGALDRDNYNFDDAGYEQMTYSFDANNVQTLLIDNVSHDINVFASNETDQVKIECYDSDYAVYHVTLSDSGKLSIIYDETERASKWFDFDWYSEAIEDLEVTVYLPYDILETLKIDTVSGDVRVIGADCKGDVNIGTVSGNINMQSNKISGEITLSTVSGVVSLEDTESKDDITVSTVSGNVNFTLIDNTGDISIGTTSGDVRLIDVSGNDFKINTVSGSCKGNIIGDVKDYTIDADSLSGNVNVPRSENGSKNLDIETTSGNIDIDIDN